MKTELRPTEIPKGEQTKAEHETHSLSREQRENAPTFHVKTNVSAGWYPGMYFDEWFAKWLG